MFLSGRNEDECAGPNLPSLLSVEEEAHPPRHGIHLVPLVRSLGIGASRGVHLHFETGQPAPPAVLWVRARRRIHACRSGVTAVLPAVY